MTPKKMRAIACCLDYLIREQSEVNCRTDLRAAGPSAKPTNRKWKCVTRGLVLSSCAPQPSRFRGVTQCHVFLSPAAKRRNSGPQCPTAGGSNLKSLTMLVGRKALEQ